MQLHVPGKSRKEKNPKGLEELCQSEENLIPLFVEKCLHYIELHGATCEGIYRVSGNKAHVNELLGKFEEGEIWFIINIVTINSVTIINIVI